MTCTCTPAHLSPAHLDVAGTKWFGSKPHKGPGAPVVIADADKDPAAATHARGRWAAVAGVAIALVAIVAIRRAQSPRIGMARTTPA